MLSYIRRGYPYDMACSKHGAQGTRPHIGEVVRMLGYGGEARVHPSVRERDRPTKEERQKRERDEEQKSQMRKKKINKKKKGQRRERVETSAQDARERERRERLLFRSQLTQLRYTSTICMLVRPPSWVHPLCESQVVYAPLLPRFAEGVGSQQDIPLRLGRRKHVQELEGRQELRGGDAS